MFGLKTAVAGAIEFGLACRMKPLAVLKQARFDPGDIRNVAAAEPKRIAHACRSLLGCSFSQRRPGVDCRQHKNGAHDNGGSLVRSHLALLKSDWPAWGWRMRGEEHHRPQGHKYGLVIRLSRPPIARARLTASDKIEVHAHLHRRYPHIEIVFAWLTTRAYPPACQIALLRNNPCRGESQTKLKGDKKCPKRQRY